MTQNIKNFIEEGEKSENYRLNTILADLKRGAITYDLAKYNVLDWNKNLQISLIKMIVEENNKAKLGKEYTGSIDFKLGYNTAIDTISSKLKELYE